LNFQNSSINNVKYEPDYYAKYISKRLKKTHGKHIPIEQIYLDFKSWFDKNIDKKSEISRKIFTRNMTEHHIESSSRIIKGKSMRVFLNVEFNDDNVVNYKSDVFDEYINERLVKLTGIHAPIGKVYSDFNHWFKNNVNINCDITRKIFTRNMKKHQIGSSTRRIGNKNTRVLLNVTINDQTDSDDD